MLLASSDFVESSFDVADLESEASDFPLVLPGALVGSDEVSLAFEAGDVSVLSLDLLCDD